MEESTQISLGALGPAQMIEVVSDVLNCYLPEHRKRPIKLKCIADALFDLYRSNRGRTRLELAIRLNEEVLNLRPPGDPARASSLKNLATSLRARFRLTGARADLDKMIQLETEALELRPPGSPGRAESLDNLAVSLHDQYRLTGSRADLEKAIELHTEALELRPPGNPDRAESLISLAASLTNQYRLTGSRDDLDKMIQLETEALGLRPLGSPGRAESLDSLAASLRRRYRWYGSRADLDKAIQLHTEALELRLPGNPGRAESLISLAASLTDQYRLTGSRDDLGKMIQLETEALELRPPGNPDRAESLDNLAVSLHDQYRLTGSRADLEKAIKLHTEALELRPPGNPDRAESLISLAASLTNQYRLTGSRDDLDKMIQLETEALELRPPGNTGRAESLDNLAASLRRRYRLTGSRVDLDKAIQLHTEALELRLPGNPGRAESLDNLAASLRRRYRLTGSRVDLDKAIQLHTEALEFRLPGNPDRAESLISLAASLTDQYRLTGSRDDLDKMIQLETEALELRPPGSPDRAESLNNLAASLRNRYRLTESGADLDTAIQLHTEALDLRPPRNPDRAQSLKNLASALCDRHRLIGSQPDHDPPSSVDHAFQLLQEGATDIVSPLNVTFLCALDWVDEAHKFHHATLQDAYIQCIRLLRRYLTIGPTIRLQYDVLLQEPHNLSIPMDAAAHAIECGNVKLAIELLDEGRSLLWSEMRRLREPSLQVALVGDQLAERFNSICMELQATSTAEVVYDTGSGVKGQNTREAGSALTGILYDTLISHRWKLLDDYEEVVNDIRKIPGLEDFQRRTSFNKLQQAAKEGPVIVINCSKYGSHVIIVFFDKRPTVLALGSEFHDRASNIYKAYLAACESIKNIEHVSKAFGHKLAPITKQLWYLVVSRVVEELKTAGIPEHSRIWWCPTSFLTTLPFHAAGSGEKRLIDSYISSYTPTLKALIDARQPPRFTSPESDTARAKLLVVAQTNTNLRRARKELSAMRRLGPFVDVLDAEAATHESVMESLPSYNWAHFICHGTLSDNPFDSALHLHDGDTVTLHDIVKAHVPNAQFAFLAACHSAEQGQNKLQDEILHLAAAMQSSGFRSVVGTMWAMKDADGPYLARNFYGGMFDDHEVTTADGDTEQRHTRAARALWKVTLEMKKDPQRWPLESWVNFVHIGA